MDAQQKKRGAAHMQTEMQTRARVFFLTTEKVEEEKEGANASQPGSSQARLH